MIDPQVIEQIKILANAITAGRHVIYPKVFQDWEVEDILKAAVIWKEALEKK